MASGLKEQTRFLRNLLELAVAKILEEHVAAAGAGDEEVLAAVVVVIGPGGGDADAVAQADAGPLGHVLEGAVAFVFVEGALAELVAKEDIVVAVAVEIADRHAAAVIVQVRLELLPLLAGQKIHAKGNSRFLGALLETGRPPERRLSPAGPVDLGAKPIPNQHDHHARGD